MLLNKMGYKIPEDVALIGFTNTELADAMNPPLSTVHQPAFEIGQFAAEKLIAMIEGKRLDEGFETVMLPTNIKVRASSQSKI